MKRFIALLLTLIMALSFCACGNGETSNNNDDSSNVLAVEETKYVGTWVTDDNRATIYSIRFLSNGKVLWDVGCGTDTLITDYDMIDHHGEWMIDEDRLLVFCTSNASGHNGEVFVFRIMEDTISWGGDIYTKVSK